MEAENIRIILEGVAPFWANGTWEITGDKVVGGYILQRVGKTGKLLSMNQSQNVSFFSFERYKLFERQGLLSKEK